MYSIELLFGFFYCGHVIDFIRLISNLTIIFTCLFFIMRIDATFAWCYGVFVIPNLSRAIGLIVLTWFLPVTFLTWSIYLRVLNGYFKIVLSMSHLLWLSLLNLNDFVIAKNRFLEWINWQFEARVRFWCLKILSFSDVYLKFELHSGIFLKILDILCDFGRCLVFLGVRVLNICRFRTIFIIVVGLILVC